MDTTDAVAGGYQANMGHPVMGAAGFAMRAISVVAGLLALVPLLAWGAAANVARTPLNVFEFLYTVSCNAHDDGCTVFTDGGAGGSSHQEDGAVTESEDRIPQRLLPLVGLLGEGKENDDIAKTLGYSQHTIGNYISELKELLGARGRTELAFKCMKLRS